MKTDWVVTWMVLMGICAGIAAFSWFMSDHFWLAFWWMSVACHCGIFVHWGLRND